MLPNTPAVIAIVQWSMAYGVPPWIPLCIAYVESGFNPDAQGDMCQSNGTYSFGGSCSSPGEYTSFGLFQLHIDGGQGDGYPISVLLNPQENARIGIAPIAAAYREGVSAGLQGFALLEFTADHSGHPDDTGYMDPSYLSDLESAWRQAALEQWFRVSIQRDQESSTTPEAPPYRLLVTPSVGQIGLWEPTFPRCGHVGAYAGYGPDAGVGEGLYLFQSVDQGRVTNTVVDADCHVVSRYTHTYSATPVSIAPTRARKPASFGGASSGVSGPVVTPVGLALTAGAVGAAGILSYWMYRRRQDGRM